MATVSDSVIIQDPDIHSGEPVFRGTRVPFQILLLPRGRGNAGRVFRTISRCQPRASHRRVGRSKGPYPCTLRQMKILIDECLPAKLKGALAALGHECQTVRQAGFGSKKNGELLSIAEGKWDVLLTSDRNIKHQQNMAGRKVAILILCATSNRMRICCR